MKLGLGLNLKTSGGAWTPANISSLIHWYRYDTGITKDGDEDITEWADQKGSNDLTAEGSAGVSPLYASGAVHFNSAGDLLTLDSEVSLGTFSIYCRVEGSDLTNDSLYEKHPGVSASDFFQIKATDEIRVKVGGSGRHDVSSGISLSVDTKYNLGWEREDTGSTTEDQMYVFVDGVNKPFDSGHGKLAITTALAVTTFGKPAVENKFYEIVICNNSLSASDRVKLNNYLKKI
tara:strand:+ start:20872 stop:21570 length:699 start_codon:yes stop_codon:yes gene_type:complete